MKKIRELIRDVLWCLEWMVFDPIVHLLLGARPMALVITILMCVLACYLTMIALACLWTAGYIPQADRGRGSENVPINNYFPSDDF